MIKRLLEKGVPQERISFFPNWVDIAHIKPTARPGSYRSQLGIADDAVVVLYSGTLGGQAGTDGRSRRGPAPGGPTRHRVRDLRRRRHQAAAAGGLRRTLGYPLPSSATLRKTWRIALHGKRASSSPEQGRGGSRAALEALGNVGERSTGDCDLSCGTELHAVVSTCGIVVEPEDTAALAEAICRLADDVQLRVEVWGNARERMPRRISSATPSCSASLGRSKAAKSAFQDDVIA